MYFVESVISVIPRNGNTEVTVTGISFICPVRTAVAIYCEKHGTMNTATSFLYTVYIRRRKKRSNDMNRVVEHEST